MCHIKIQNGGHVLPECQKRRNYCFNCYMSSMQTFIMQYQWKPLNRAIHNLVFYQNQNLLWFPTHTTGPPSSYLCLLVMGMEDPYDKSNISQDCWYFHQQTLSFNALGALHFTSMCSFFVIINKFMLTYRNDALHYPYVFPDLTK